MAEPLIRLENLMKVFETDEVETHALSNIHLTIDRGEYIAIAGPSGCGKSTLLSILGLLDSPTSGSYTLNGRAVQDLDAADRARAIDLRHPADGEPAEHLVVLELGKAGHGREAPRIPPWRRRVKRACRRRSGRASVRRP